MKLSKALQCSCLTIRARARYRNHRHQPPWHGEEPQHTPSAQSYQHPLLSCFLHTKARATLHPHALPHAFTHTTMSLHTFKHQTHIAWSMLLSPTSSTPLPTDSPLCQLCTGRIYLCERLFEAVMDWSNPQRTKLSKTLTRFMTCQKYAKHINPIFSEKCPQHGWRDA